MSVGDPAGIPPPPDFGRASTCWPAFRPFLACFGPDLAQILLLHHKLCKKVGLKMLVALNEACACTLQGAHPETRTSRLRKAQTHRSLHILKPSVWRSGCQALAPPETTRTPTNQRNPQLCFVCVGVKLRRATIPHRRPTPTLGSLPFEISSKHARATSSEGIRQPQRGRRPTPTHAWISSDNPSRSILNVPARPQAKASLGVEMRATPSTAAGRHQRTNGSLRTVRRDPVYTCPCGLASSRAKPPTLHSHPHHSRPPRESATSQSL